MIIWPCNVSAEGGSPEIITKKITAFFFLTEVERFRHEVLAELFKLPDDLSTIDNDTVRALLQVPALAKAGPMQLGQAMSALAAARKTIKTMEEAPVPTEDLSSSALPVSVRNPQVGCASKEPQEKLSSNGFHLGSRPAHACSI